MLAPLLWVGPAVVLIGAVVIWPAVEMVRTSLLRISFSGTEKGFTGLDNYARLLANPALPGVMARTAIWVFAVVAITMVISLFLGQLLNQQFPGRRLVRIALIVPWAASVGRHGDDLAIYVRQLLRGAGPLAHRPALPRGAPIDWLGNPTLAFACVIAVAVFVSLPFTTVVIIAGLGRGSPTRSSNWPGWTGPVPGVRTVRSRSHCSARRFSWPRSSTSSTSSTRFRSSGQ